MYIKKVEISNIRSIDHFEMAFENPAGWHVLIGDNGSGKTTILRAIAFGLIGPANIQATRFPIVDWVQEDKEFGTTLLNIVRSHAYDRHLAEGGSLELLEKDNLKLNTTNELEILLEISKKQRDGFEMGDIKITSKQALSKLIWSGKKGWFSAGFGPFRRFTGGSGEWKDVFGNIQLTRLSSHLSLFDESVALTETTSWLMKLQFEVFEQKSNYLHDIKDFINSYDFLPNGTKLKEINSEGVVFVDGYGATVLLQQLSDGLRSLLSLTLELLRLIINSYSGELIFQKKHGGDIFIILPGVVLIDEIDAHLHPTWQTRIGEWFTKYFPNIQFIVTTHSPLVCRACERGSIWRLAAPGSNAQSGEITGVDRDRLIYGNVLDAYGTEVFGPNVSQSANAEQMLKELADLNLKSFKGTISDDENRRMQELKTILPTE